MAERIAALDARARRAPGALPRRRRFANVRQLGTIAALDLVVERCRLSRRAPDRALMQFFLERGVLLRPLGQHDLRHAALLHHARRARPHLCRYRRGARRPGARRMSTSADRRSSALATTRRERRVANAEIEQRLGLEPGWIVRRTGIEERRYAADGEALTDIAVPAARDGAGAVGARPRRHRPHACWRPARPTTFCRPRRRCSPIAWVSATRAASTLPAPAPASSMR